MDDTILAIERPHPSLWKLYVIRALLSGPGALVMLPYLYFRYHTMRYAFDQEGVHMRWGILFRKEINLTYARIQDIHITSGPLQRWLGLANVHIQTASGTAGAEMTIEGLREFEAIRDFLYARMRGTRDRGAKTASGPTDGSAVLLQEILGELRGAREALQRRASGGAP